MLADTIAYLGVAYQDGTHTTLQYIKPRTSNDTVKQIMNCWADIVGDVVTVEFLEYCLKGDWACIRVALPSFLNDYFSGQYFPHITVSKPKDGRAVDSPKIFADPSAGHYKMDRREKGVVTIFNRRNEPIIDTDWKEIQNVLLFKKKLKALIKTMGA